jgi:trigger factor
MANIERHDIDTLNVGLTLTISKDEVADKFKKELNRMAQRAAIKGFRKGKTPVSYIKKMYGAEILNDLVNNTIAESVSNFIDNEKLDILGQPIPSEDENKNSFSIENFEDLTFKFDIGLAPQFELNGLSKESKFEKYIPDVPVAWIDEAIETDRGRQGERSTIEGGDLKDKDIIKLNVKEVDGSLEKSFSVLFDDLSDDVKATVADKKVGDSFVLNIMTMEKNADENRVRKYILGVEEDVTFNNDFDATIEEITRIVPANLDEAFFTKAYGENVTTEEQAREFLRGEFSKYFEGDSWGLMVRDLQEHLLNSNPLDLPDAFLKRWLQFSDERNTKELVERDYTRFSNNLRWTLLRDRIIEEFNVHIHDEDLKEVYRDRVRASYGAQLGEEFLDYFAERMLEEGRKKKSKEHQDVEESAMFNQVFKTIAKQVDVIDVNVTWDEFNAKREVALASARNAQDGEAIASPFEDAEVVE